jgi:hypothetical protein
MAFRLHETLLHRHHKVASQEVQKTVYEFYGPFPYLKHYLNDFIKVNFFHAQDAEKEFVWTLETVKRRFIDFTSLF